MQKKDYQNWHAKKTIIHNEKERPFFHEREVWFSSIGENIGFEQDGKGREFLRPVIILKKFNNEIFWGIPTTKGDRNGKYYFKFLYKDNDSTTAIISQLRVIDSKRLRYSIGIIQEHDFIEIKKRVISFLK